MNDPAPASGGGVAGVVLAAGSSSRLGTPKQLLRYRGETLLHRTVRLALAAGLDPVHVVLGCSAPVVGAALEDLGSRVTTVINPHWQTGMGSSLARGIASLPAATGVRPGRDADAGTESVVSAETGSIATASPSRGSGAGTEPCRAAVPDPDHELGAACLKPGAAAAARSAPVARTRSCTDSGAAIRSDSGAGMQSSRKPASGTAAGAAPGAALVLVTDQPRLSPAILAEIAAAFRTGGAPLVASRYAGGALGVPALFARRYFPELTRLTGDRGARSLFTRYRDDLLTVAFPEGDLDIDTPSAAASLQSE
ncbi:MAG: nucleotidyltransferase family protein [Spirochaetaceae bacterium]|nr:nucleotidyltransferase family protein [Spirochaetaceae bacterium]